MACQEAIRLFQRRPEVKPIREFWYMEVPSCTDWALNSAMNRFQPNTWVEVGKEGVEAKVKALSMYRGVMRLYPHPRSADGSGDGSLIRIQDLLKLSEASLPIVAARLDVITQRLLRW